MKKLKQAQLLILSLSFILVFLSCGDPCKKITCQNDGICNDGDCECKPGYSGDECQTEKIPIKIVINKIEILKMPAVPSGGGGWDSNNGPDIFVKISNGSNTVWDSPTYIVDANVNSQYNFVPSPSIEITSPTTQHTIELYDYDTGSASDNMGGYYFNPYNDLVKGRKFPTSLTIEGSLDLKFKIYVSYIF
jgi:hypothetical protein